MITKYLVVKNEYTFTVCITTANKCTNKNKINLYAALARNLFMETGCTNKKLIIVK